MVFQWGSIYYKLDLEEINYGGSDTRKKPRTEIFLGTLKGIFPKFILTFRKLNQTELEDISDILDSATQTVTYYSPKKKAMNTIGTYSGDWEYQNKYIQANESFECSFVSRTKEV